jgi:hypothetical protein
MRSNGHDNLKNLEDAGMFLQTPPPDSKLAAVIYELDPEDVAAMIRIKDRLDSAGISPEKDEFRTFVHWF